MTVESSRVIYRDMPLTYPTIVRGEGIYLFDDQGNRYIDGSGGSSAVTAIGHGVPRSSTPSTEQAARLAYAPMHAFTTEPPRALARVIIEEFAPGFAQGLVRLRRLGGDRERGENGDPVSPGAGEGSQHLVIGRRSSFHGATIAALAFGGNAGRRRRIPRSCSEGNISPPATRIAAAAAEPIPPCDLSCADDLERRSVKSARRTSPRSSPSRWWGRLSARCPPVPVLPSGRSATATRSSSSPTR